MEHIYRVVDRIHVGFGFFLFFYFNVSLQGGGGGDLLHQFFSRRFEKGAHLSRRKHGPLSAAFQLAPLKGSGQHLDPKPQKNKRPLRKCGPDEQKPQKPFWNPPNPNRKPEKNAKNE